MMRQSSSAGFTLLEIMMAAVVGSFLILGSIQLYQTVYHTSLKFEMQDRFFVRQQFLRNQLLSLDTGLMSHLGFDPRSLFTSQYVRFPTTRSSQFGYHSFPVMAQYTFEKDRLIYREKRLSGWLVSQGAQLQSQARQWEGPAAFSPQDREAVFLTHVSDPKIDYWDPVHQTFTDSWRQRGMAPPLVRLRFNQEGQPQTWYLKLPEMLKK